MAYDSYYNPSGPYEPPHHLEEQQQQQQQANEQQTYNSNASYNTPYPSQHVADHVQMPQPRMPSPSYQNQSPPSTAGNASYGHVNNGAAPVAYPTDNTGNPNYLSPDLISQVTATVIQQLRAYGLDGFQGQHQQQPPPLPPHPQAPQEQPVPPAPDTSYYNQPAPYREDVRGQESNLAPPERQDVPVEKRSAGPGSSLDPRSTILGRVHTQEELTTLEKIWGKLFDNGKPTARLGQLLRGIAVHLIEDYPPGNTIVVVPDKMQKYYADTKVSTDTYPWQVIFDDRTSSISRIYRDIEAEHHLVQDPVKLRERPDIPGLTPRGFEKWYTLMIQANPEREFARLQRTVLDMPISNPDDKKERFPKELSRRLFPSSPDLKILEKLEASIITHCEVELPRNPVVEERGGTKSPGRRTPIEKSPSRVPTMPGRVSPAGVSAATPKSGSQEREARDARDASLAVIDGDDEDTLAAPRPIERERKPYSAQPGGGKVYEDGITTVVPKSESSPSGVGGRSSHTHAHSSSSTGSAAGHHAHHGSISSTKPSHTRSSSVGLHAAKAGDYRRSEPDLSSYEPTYVTTTDGGGHLYKTSSGTAAAGAGGGGGDVFVDDDRDRPLYRNYDRDRDDTRDYELLRERERERERRYHDHLSGSGRSTWNDEDYYRGLLGGQGGGPEYKYR